MDKKKSLILAIVLIVVFIGIIACTQSFRGKDSTGGSTSSGTTSGTTKTGNSSSAVARILSKEDQFTERDLKQEADLIGAKSYEVADNTDIEITEEGVYVISGTAQNVTIYVKAADDAKVQLVLDNLSITNQDKECIHVETADKVFVTTKSKSSLKYQVIDTENATGAILSRSDLILNGTDALEINSEDNAIVGKDDVKITGGTYSITASKNAIRANDSIRIAGGTFTLKAGTDGLHAENNDDDSKGYIYITDGTLNIDVADDAIHAVSVVQIDGGTIDITAAEGMEGTYIQINDGTITMNASDDGINAAKKSSAYTPTVEINGGNITINMGQGDTDGVDSNGDIIINGGTISVTGNSTFDYDGKAEHNGGTIIINGEETETIPNQFGGGMPGGFGGRGGQGFPTDFSGDFGGGRGFSRDGSGDFPSDFDGQMTPPDFDGSNFPQDMSGDFSGRPSKGSRTQRSTEQSSSNAI